MSDLFMRRDAIISECGLYRYRLSRTWDIGPTCAFVMLNPSTADADLDDPTIRRCLGFARREGCGSLVVVNLFAYRATDPTALLQVFVNGGAEAAVGPENPRHVWEVISGNSGPVIAAWGADRTATGPARSILERYRSRLLCLGKTQSGAPRHPLYVPASQPLVAL